MNSKTFSLIIKIACCIHLLAALSYADEAKEKAAAVAAESWLSTIDSGDYGTSWGSASSILKNVLSQEQWASTMTAVRKPLGTLVSRSVASKEYRTTLPGAPDGEYVVLQFQTSFSNKKSAVETVTPKKEDDGTWRVAGYYIK